MSKRVPFFMQHDIMDCGPTCLRMIAAYYGKSISLETLRGISYISQEGVCLLGISVAAEKIEFRSLGVLITLEQLISDVPLPCLIHWEQEYFVVLYNIKKKKNR